METKIEFKGYYLDDQNIVSPAVNYSGETVWYLITFTKPVIDGEIKIDKHGDQFFEIREIDPNDFEWNGQQLKIDFGENNAQKDSETLAKSNIESRNKAK